MTLVLFLFLALITTALFFYFLTKEKQASSQALGKIEQATNEISFLRGEKEKLEKKAEEKISFLQEKLSFFEKQNELLKQGQQYLESEKREWEKNKDAMLLKTSEELIRKNSEQQNQIGAQLSENMRKITGELFEKLGAFDSTVKKSSELMNDLLTPKGAGKTAEITLENILKKSNLREKESLFSDGDYVLQSHFKVASSIGALRPDAILFLPDNQILVIDCKSSPHFAELENAKSDAERKEIEKLLKTAFRSRLEDLKGKNYSGFLLDELRKKEEADYKIFTAIFLQTEGMLETVCRVDSEFEQRAADSTILLLTPISMRVFLNHVKFVINRLKQEKNIENLKVEIQKFFDEFARIITKSEKLGNQLRTASKTYNELTINLNKATKLNRKISDLSGIEGKKSGEVRLLEEFTLEEESSENN
jgi:DNA recombination protein RmuC